MNIKFKHILLEAAMLLLAFIICLLIIYCSMLVGESYYYRLAMYLGIVLSMPLGGVSWLFYYLWQLSADTSYFVIWCFILYFSIYGNIKLINYYFYTSKK